MTPLAAFVSRHDPDRYFCTLFAPANKRDALFTLYAFNHELAKAQDIASQPALALIRLQWWREVVDGAPKRHEVASPLLALIAAGVLERAAMLALIDARDDAVSAPPATPNAFLDAMRAGPGGLAASAGAVLGASADEQARLRTRGAAYGIAGTLRNAAAMGRGAAPDTVLAQFGDELRAAGLDLAGRLARWPRGVVAAALPGVLARRDLRRPAPVVARGIGDRAAILGAALRSRA